MEGTSCGRCAEYASSKNNWKAAATADIATAPLKAKIPPGAEARRDETYGESFY
jgi:hypothetical protein